MVETVSFIVLTVMGKILQFNKGRKHFVQSKLKKAGNLLLFSLIAILLMSTGYQAEGICSDTMELVL